MIRLMCPPDYFDIEYSINPWMKIGDAVDKSLAFSQWRQLIGILEGLGDEIRYIDPAPGLPDMTFAGDGGLVWKNRFVPSNFLHPERQGEAELYARWFERNGFEIFRIPEGIRFEGLGDVVFHEGLAFFGYGCRSDERALGYLAQAIPELNVLGRLKIVDDHYFHLAMALSFIDADTLLYYPPAFSADSVNLLRRTARNLIEVGDVDANDYFACNNIVVGNTVIIDNCTSQLRANLGALGYKVKTVDMSEFKKSGGSLRCLALSFM